MDNLPKLPTPPCMGVGSIQILGVSSPFPLPFPFPLLPSSPYPSPIPPRVTRAPRRVRRGLSLGQESGAFSRENVLKYTSQYVCFRVFLKKC
jgi:hypothetical protein